MGTGKTKTTIEILRMKCNQERRALKTLIVCPLVVMENWKREILTHSFIEENKIQIVDGCTKPNGKKLKNATKNLRLDQLQNNKAQIFILNTDNVSNLPVWEMVLALGVEFLVIDESHRFKNPTGVRSNNMFKLASQEYLKYKFILTGSPILQSALDLWSQFRILDPDILGKNFFSFRCKYFYDANANMPSHVHFPNWQPKKDGAMSTLNEVIYRHADRVMKDDVLDLPERTYQTLEVPLAKTQRRLYDEMRDTLVAFLEEPINVQNMFDLPDVSDLDIPELMRADLAIVKTIRLQQLICGIFTSSEGDIKEIETNRIKVLKELIEELSTKSDNKLIVWTTFAPTYPQIAKICMDLKVKFVMLTGQQTKEEKQINIDEFNTGSAQVIIANQAAGGTGVNLTAANYEIFYSRSYN